LAIFGRLRRELTTADFAVGGGGGGLLDALIAVIATVARATLILLLLLRQPAGGSTDNEEQPATKTTTVPHQLQLSGERSMAGNSFRAPAGPHLNTYRVSLATHYE
jgi:hypothetical protein